MADVTLPTQEISAPLPPEAGKISVLSPQGQTGSIPIGQLGDALGQGFRLPGMDLQASDLTEDRKSVRVISKEGAAGIIPIEQLQPALAQGFQLSSQTSPEEVQDNLSKVDANLKALTSGASLKDLAASHKSDDINDEKGNYKLVAPNGESVAVDPKNLVSMLQAGFKFKDANYQALIDAHGKMAKQGDVGESVNAATKAWQDTYFGLGSWGRNRDIADVERGKTDRAFDIAEELASKEGVHKTAEVVGTGIGIGQQVLMPGGMFGEGALAAKAAQAIKGAKALEASPIIASVLSHAAQGMIISAPQTADALFKGNPKLAAESLGIGALGGVVFGELPNIINKLSGKALPGAVDKALTSLGATAETDIMKLDSQAKAKILDTLMEAGLKESSTAENALKAINKVSAGDHMVGTLAKLDEAGEKVLTGQVAGEISNLIKGAEKISPELENAAASLTKKMEKLFPQGEGSLEQVQKVVSDLSKDISKAKVAGEVNNFNMQARDLLLNEMYRVGDQAALNADAKTVAAWAEQKSISQAATAMQSGFESQIAAAEAMANKGLIPDLKEKIVEGGVKHLFHAGAAAAGHAVLPGVGGFVGAKLGENLAEKLAPTIGEHVAPLLKKILPDNAGKNWLIKNANNPNISSYLTINAVHNANETISKIGSFLKEPVTKSALFAMKDDPIKSILGNEANGLSKTQQFDRLSSKIATLAGDPQARQRYVDFMSYVLGGNHPELAEGLKQELTNKIMATNKLLHGDNSGEPKAFQAPQKYTPTKDKMAEIEAGLNAIENPYSILSGLKDGKVSQKQVDLVKETHPAIYQEMVNELNKAAYGGKVTLSYQERLTASKITGQPMDPSLKMGQALQATYTSQPAPTGASSTGKKHGGGQGKGKINAGVISSYTAAQRVSKS